MIDRYRAGVVPAPETFEPLDDRLREHASALASSVGDAIGKLLPHAALDALFGFFEAVNKYITDAAPWDWAKRCDRATTADERDRADRRLSTILYLLAESIRVGAYLLGPFLPETSTEILSQLGIAPHDSGAEVGAGTPFGKYPPHFVTKRGKILFPKSA
jgi:methionyl-tRNA synthetase